MQSSIILLILSGLATTVMARHHHHHPKHSKTPMVGAEEMTTLLELDEKAVKGLATAEEAQILAQAYQKKILPLPPKKKTTKIQDVFKNSNLTLMFCAQFYKSLLKEDQAFCDREVKKSRSKRSDTHIPAPPVQPIVKRIQEETASEIIADLRVLRKIYDGKVEKLRQEAKDIQRRVPNPFDMSAEEMDKVVTAYERKLLPLPTQEFPTDVVL